MSKNKSFNVKRVIRNPATGRQAREVIVAGRLYRWNSVYRVYNAVDNYDQLKLVDLPRVEFKA